MLSRNRYALKEWDGLCSRLGRGEEILLLRKGGLLDRREGFPLEHREFFLFPTRFHEAGEAPPARVELSLYANVEADVRVNDLERLRALAGRQSVPWEDVERRFRYGNEPGLHVLALRAWRLARPETVENAGAYAGCRSWVELDRERPVETEKPALDEAEFARRWAEVKAILDG